MSVAPVYREARMDMVRSKEKDGRMAFYYAVGAWGNKTHLYSLESKSPKPGQWTPSTQLTRPERD